MYNSPDLAGDPCLRETKTWTLDMFITSTSLIRRWSISLIVSINWAVTKTLLIYDYLLYMYINVYRFDIYGVRLPSCTGIILSHYKDSYEPASILECHKGFVCFLVELTCWTLSSLWRVITRETLIFRKFPNEVSYQDEEIHKTTPIQKLCCRNVEKSVV